MNAVLPSRGRHCRRRPPLLVYPDAMSSQRLYSRQEELSIFQIQRVYDYLAAGRWLRRTSSKGQFRFYSEALNVKKPYARQIVVVTFNPQTRQFQVSPAQSEQILLTFELDWLSLAGITGLG